MAVISKSFVGDTLKNALLIGGISFLDNIGANTNSGDLSSRYSSITWGSPSSGSVSITGTSPVINIPSGVTIKYIIVGQFNSGVGGVDPYLEFLIDEEVFAYAGTITIDGLTLSISNTIG